MQPYPDEFMISFKLFGTIEHRLLAPNDTLKKSRKAEIPDGQPPLQSMCDPGFVKGECEGRMT